MSPTIVYGPDGKVVLAVGSAGGKRIIMHVTKVLISVLDWGLDAKAAMELPNLFFGRDGVLIENNAAGQAIAAEMNRTAERRVGKEWVRTWRSRGSQYREKIK